MFGYLCHVDLMAGELTQLDSWDVMCDQDVAVGTPFDNDLRLVGRGASFVPGFIVHGVFQLPAICRDLRTNAGNEKRTTLLQQLHNTYKDTRWH